MESLSSGVVLLGNFESNLSESVNHDDGMSLSSMSHTSKEPVKNDVQNHKEEYGEVQFSSPRDILKTILKNEVQRSEKDAGKDKLSSSSNISKQSSKKDAQHNAQEPGKEDEINKKFPTLLTITSNNKNVDGDLNVTNEFDSTTKATPNSTQSN
eukprot:8598584-Ditylum_brightwellii.AAC.1